MDKIPSIGDEILIKFMKDEPQYSGARGILRFIDDAGMLHGTWGGCAIIPEVDRFEVIEKEEKENE